MIPDTDTRTALAQQIIAADPSQSVWVSANAGTGKTRVLVDRISRLLLAGTQPGKILCLTFTKAAAAEMANRLSTRLGGWAVVPEDELHRQLTELLGRAVADEDAARARKLFAEVLDTPGGLKIRTIHSFCESLLGQFPLEAGVAPHFAVIDERTESELLLEARDVTLRRAADESSPRTANNLARLAAVAGEAGFDAVIRELVGNRRRFRDAIRHYGSVGGLLTAMRNLLGLDEDETADSLLAAAGEDAAFDRSALDGAASALMEGSKTDQQRAGTILAWIKASRDERMEGLQGDYADVFLTKSGDPRAESRVMTKAVREAYPAAFDAMLAEQQRLLALNEKLKAASTAEMTAALVTLGDVLVTAYQTLKERRGLLDYDDLILKARALLNAEGQAAWVHFKLDGGIDHILVDEAQDTSPEQWDVIAALTGEFFAGEGARAGERTVFAVGDEKQSIYSFQGADPEAFSRMASHFAERARQAGRPWRDVEMPLSFRSVWAVLRGVDRVFETPQSASGLTFGGKAIRHLPYRRGQAGRIELWPTVKPEETPDDDPWDAPLDQLPAASPQVQLADRIADTIDGWLKSGEILEPRGRPIAPDDIMILVRRRERFAEEMIRCLKKRNIPVAGSDRMVLTDQIAVMDLLALARFLLLPDDDLSLAEVLKGPLFDFDDDQLFDLAYGREIPLWRQLSRRAGERPLWLETRRMLTGFLDRVDFIRPFEFFSQVLGPEGGRRKLVRRLGAEANDPIDEFLALALDYEREHVPSLQGFLQWIESGETQIKRDLEHDRREVRVMTVHGAKGLQANIVFLPDTCSAPDARLDARVLWSGDDEDAVPLWPGYRDNEESVCRALREESRERQMQEYRRLLYVAMTRACDRLYVCGWETKRGRAEGCWYDLIAGTMKDTAREVDLGFGEPALRLDDPQEAEPDGKRAAAAPEAPDSALPAWALRPAPNEPDPPRPLTPSRPDGEDPPVRSPLGEDSGARFKRGRLVHALLQTLPGLEPEKRRAAAEAYLARSVHGLDADTRRALAAETIDVIEDPEFAPLFGPGSHAEVPVVGQVNGRIISAQVDRLLVTADAVTVVDFKTNRPPPATESGVPDIYLGQMAAYREALRHIYPDRPVRCVLLWTDGPRAMPLSDVLLDRHIP